jgi:peroxiredoxin
LEIGHKTQVKVDIKQPGALLKGNALPKFDNIKIDLVTKDYKGKKLLICFFDMNQRPSRRCISELPKQIEKLKKKDVVVIAIQTSKINQDRLDEWTKGRNFSFPIGLIDKDIEKTRFTWGIESLPWLILTDSRHLVVDSGFGLTELDDKLSTSN